MKEPSTILIVEDDPDITQVLVTLLKGNGYEVMYAKTGAQAVDMAAAHTFGLILLDLGLPDTDGMQVLHSIREWSDVPVIIVSARQNEQEKVNALDAGANDYVSKPFGNGELLARIRTALRLHEKLYNYRPGSSSRFSAGSLVIDYSKRKVMVKGKIIHLTPIEYKILVLLSQNAGKVLTHDTIISEVWGKYGSDSQTLRVNMANIRRKLEENPADPKYILTEVGVGYRMKDIEAAVE